MRHPHPIRCQGPRHHASSHPLQRCPRQRLRARLHPEHPRHLCRGAAERQGRAAAQRQPDDGNGAGGAQLHDREIKPHLDPMLEATFLPQTVPAYSAIETFARLQKKYPDFSYREATLNPTNPAIAAPTGKAASSMTSAAARTAKSSVSVNRPAGRASTSPDRSGSPIPPAWPATARPPPRLPRCSPSMARTTASAGSSTKSSAPRSSSSPPTSRSATRCMPSGHSPQYSAHSSCCSS